MIVGRITLIIDGKIIPASTVSNGKMITLITLIINCFRQKNNYPDFRQLFFFVVIHQLGNQYI